MEKTRFIELTAGSKDNPSKIVVNIDLIVSVSPGRDGYNHIDLLGGGTYSKSVVVQESYEFLRNILINDPNPKNRFETLES